MFHISNLGVYGSDLSSYTDQDGYVPEAKDRDTVPDWYHEQWHELDGADHPDCDDSDDCSCAHIWRCRVNTVVRLTKEAEKALNGWQQDIQRPVDCLK